MSRLKPRAGIFAVFMTVLSITILAFLHRIVGDGDPGSDARSGSGALVDEEVLTTALESDAPARPTMTDELEHFEARLASSGGTERFASRRLFSAYLLRFRAYGAKTDLAAAREHLHALGSDELTPDVLSLRSSFALVTHDFGEALEAAREANRRAGDFDPGLRLRMFDALWAAGAGAEAESILDLPFDRGSLDYLIREARLLDGLGRVAEARENMARVVDLTRAYAEPLPVIAWALTEHGHFELHSGRPEQAVSRYLEALELLPGSPAAIEGLARVAWGIDRSPARAVVLFDHAIRNGGHLDLHLALADAADDAGWPARAVDARARFLARATADPKAEGRYLRPLALLLADHHPDRFDRARTYAERDLAARPASQSWATRAWVRYRSGDLDGALSDAQRATAWGAPEPFVLYVAGVIADEAGERERAVQLLSEAAEAAPELTFAEIAEVRRRLASPADQRRDG